MGGMYSNGIHGKNEKQIWRRCVVYVTQEMITGILLDIHANYASS